MHIKFTFAYTSDSDNHPNVLGDFNWRSIQLENPYENKPNWRKMETLIKEWKKFSYLCDFESEQDTFCAIGKSIGEDVQAQEVTEHDLFPTIYPSDDVRIKIENIYQDSKEWYAYCDESHRKRMKDFYIKCVKTGNSVTLYDEKITIIFFKKGGQGVLKVK